MDNKPIPHLYSAGELGSYYVDLYQGAGNMSECIFAVNTVIEKQSTEVDTVSGATVTSKAIIEAVNNALEQAKK